MPILTFPAELFLVFIGSTNLSLLIIFLLSSIKLLQLSSYLTLLLGDFIFFFQFPSAPHRLLTPFNSEKLLLLTNLPSYQLMLSHPTQSTNLLS
jgi:hypothetical protein